MGGEKETELNRYIAGQIYRIGEAQSSEQSEAPADAEHNDVYTHQPGRKGVYSAEQSTENEAEKPLRYRSAEEKRQRIKEEIQAHPELKHWEIAKRLEVTPPTVKQHASKLVRSGEIPRRKTPRSQ